MREIGSVESVENGIAKVRIVRKSACGENCANCKGGCTPTEQIISAKNEAGAKKGDRVAIQMQTSYVLLAAFLVYILPLIMLFLMYAIVYAASKSEGVSVLAGIIMMLVSFFAVKKADRKLKDKYIPIVAYVL